MPNAEAALLDLCLRAGSDIDIELVDFRNLFVLLIPQVNCRIPQDAKHRTLIAKNFEPLSSSNRTVASSDPRDVEKSIVSDILDHETDLIGVSLEHDTHRGIAPFHGGPGIAVSIVLQRVSEASDVVHPDFLPFGFKPGRAGS